MPTTLGKWATTQTVSRRSSLLSRPMRSSPAAPTCPIRPNARSYITRLSSSLRFAPVARTFPRTMRYPSSGATGPGSTWRRDMQAIAKKTGRPWDMAKGFDHSAPMGDLVPADRIDPSTGAIELKVNGTVRQSSDLSKMIWNVPETIAYLSRLVRLAPGDLIMTGTPEGVGAALPGDVLEGAIAGIGTVRTRIV